MNDSFRIAQLCLDIALAVTAPSHRDEILGAFREAGIALEDGGVVLDTPSSATLRALPAVLKDGHPTAAIAVKQTLAGHGVPYGSR